MPGTTLPSGPAASEIENSRPISTIHSSACVISARQLRPPIGGHPRQSLYHLLSLVVLVIPMRSDATVHIRWNRPPKPSPSLPGSAGDAECLDRWNWRRITKSTATACASKRDWPSPTSRARTGWKAASNRPNPGPCARSRPESSTTPPKATRLPFEADQTHELKRVGQELLLFVRNKRAYHYVIDRFGRVHRIVEETDTANHAGNSVWADSQWVYLDLNRSFLGIGFEARTATDGPALESGQMHAARILTEMLRSKYNLPAGNCVTHAQVSVNPDNMRVGWHTDWGSNFPFQEVGLPDNYQQPLSLPVPVRLRLRSGVHRLHQLPPSGRDWRSRMRR